MHGTGRQQQPHDPDQDADAGLAEDAADFSRVGQNKSLTRAVMVMDSDGAHLPTPEIGRLPEFVPCRRGWIGEEHDIECDFCRVYNQPNISVLRQPGTGAFASEVPDRW